MNRQQNAKKHDCLCIRSPAFLQPIDILKRFVLASESLWIRLKLPLKRRHTANRRS